MITRRPCLPPFRPDPRTPQPVHLHESPPSRSDRLNDAALNRRLVYTHPSDRAVKSVKSKIKTLTGRQTTNTEPRMVYIFLGQALRGWTAYFRHGASKITFSELEHYLWHRVWKWLRRRRRRRNWRWIVRTYGNPATGGAYRRRCGLVQPPAKVPIQRYRYRGNTIATPWSARPDGWGDLSR
ncbi:group II intron maturase-specific domain-containing protein [Streptomyces sp. NPDC051976]|uniref:group II intron maturase-specific domain-containing protein n=1 Tax=Streptomyces sp. NPDC051976 TaxID=3154947 RepID=UPI00342BF7E9